MKNSEIRKIIKDLDFKDGNILIISNEGKQKIKELYEGCARCQHKIILNKFRYSLMSEWFGIEWCEENVISEQDMPSMNTPQQKDWYNKFRK